MVESVFVRRVGNVPLDRGRQLDEDEVWRPGVRGHSRAANACSGAAPPACGYGMFHPSPPVL